MASIPELLDGHVTLEVECLDRLYLNGYIGPLATSGGLVFAASKDGNRIVLDASGGKALWSYQTGAATHISPICYAMA